MSVTIVILLIIITGLLVRIEGKIVENINVNTDIHNMLLMKFKIEDGEDREKLIKEMHEVLVKRVRPHPFQCRGK